MDSYFARTLRCYLSKIPLRNIYDMLLSATHFSTLKNAFNTQGGYFSGSQKKRVVIITVNNDNSAKNQQTVFMKYFI